MEYFKTTSIIVMGLLVVVVVAILRPAALCMYQFAVRSLIIPFSALIGILAVDELCPQGVAADQLKYIFPSCPLPER